MNEYTLKTVVFSILFEKNEMKIKTPKTRKTLILGKFADITKWLIKFSCTTS